MLRDQGRIWVYFPEREQNQHYLISKGDEAIGEVDPLILERNVLEEVEAGCETKDVGDKVLYVEHVLYIQVVQLNHHRTAH